MFCIAYLLYKISNNNDSKKLPPMPYEIEEYKKNSSQKQKLPQTTYETDKNKKKFALDNAPQKIVQFFNRNITDKEFIIPIKSDECLYLVYDFKADYLKKAFFNTKKYEYDVDDKDYIDKCILVGKNSNIKFYLNTSSFKKYDDSICGTIYFF